MITSLHLQGVQGRLVDLHWLGFGILTGLGRL